jgi:hypothetical protein
VTYIQDHDELLQWLILGW